MKLEAELELERQRLISEETQKTRELEAEAMRLEVEGGLRPGKFRRAT